MVTDKLEICGFGRKFVFDERDSDTIVESKRVSHLYRLIGDQKCELS